MGPPNRANTYTVGAGDIPADQQPAYAPATFDVPARGVLGLAGVSSGQAPVTVPRGQVMPSGLVAGRDGLYDGQGIRQDAPAIRALSPEQQAAQALMQAIGQATTQQPRGLVGEGLAATYRATAQGARGVSGLAQMAGIPIDPQAQALTEALPQAFPKSTLPADAGITKQGAYYLTNLAGESAPSLAPLAFGAIPGVGPGLAIGAMTAQAGAETAGNTYIDARARGADPTTATTEALFTGGASALLNSLPASQMASKFVTGNPAVKAALGKIIASEGGQKALNVAIGSQVNGATGAADTTMRAIMRAAFENDPEAFATLPEDALHAWLGGTIVGGAIEGREFLPGPKAPDVAGGQQFGRDVQDAYRRGQRPEDAPKMPQSGLDSDLSPTSSNLPPTTADYAGTPNVEGIRPADVTTLDNPEAVRQSTTDLRDQPAPKASPQDELARKWLRTRTDDEFRTIKLADADQLDRLAATERFGGLVDLYRTRPDLVAAEMGRRPSLGTSTQDTITYLAPKDGAGHMTSDDPALIFEARKGDESAGYALLVMPPGKPPYVGQITIKPELRKQGIASNLYAQIDTYLQSNKLRPLQPSRDLSPGTQRIWQKRMSSGRLYPGAEPAPQPPEPVKGQDQQASRETFVPKPQESPQPEGIRVKAPAANVEGAGQPPLVESVRGDEGLGNAERAPEGTPTRDAGGATGVRGGVTKEPWQMTRAEFRKQTQWFHGTSRESADAIERQGFLPATGYLAGERPQRNIGPQEGQSVWLGEKRLAARYAVTPPDWAPTIDGPHKGASRKAGIVPVAIKPEAVEGRDYRLTEEHGRPVVEVMSPDAVQTHRQAIEHALSEGKPIPPEVLADYPDLAAKYEAKATDTPATMTREQLQAELDARGVKYGPKVKTENLRKKVESLRAKEPASEAAATPERAAPSDVDGSRRGGVAESPVARPSDLPEPAAVASDAGVPASPERGPSGKATGEAPRPVGDGGGGVKPKTMRAPEIPKTSIHRTINEEVPDYVTKPGRAGQQLRDTSTAETLRDIATNANTGYWGAGEVSDYTRLMSLVGWMDKAGNLRETSMVGIAAKRLRPGDSWDIDGRFTMTVTKTGPEGVTIHAHDRQSYEGQTAYSYTVPADKKIPANKGSITRGNPIDNLVPAKTTQEMREANAAIEATRRYNRRSTPKVEPAPGEPGVQGGLLGERFKGGITGEQGRMFETRTGESALTADERARADARTAESSRDTETAGMFEEAPFQTLRELSQSAAPSNRSGRIPVDPIIDAPPKTIKQITLDMTKELGPVYTKNPGKASAAGVYKPGTAETVIRYAGDLDTTAHEVGHKLDDAYGLVADYASAKTKSPFDAELIPHFSQYGSKGKTLAYRRAEGVAEWLRAYMVNPEAAKAAAPQFYDHFTKTVPPEVRAKIESFGNDIRGFVGQSAHGKTLANIETDPNKRTITEKIADIWGNKSAIIDRLKADTTDSFAPLWTGIEAAKAMKGIDELLPSKNPQRMIRTFAGIDGKIESIYDKGMIDAEGNHIAKRGGVDWLIEPLKGKDKAETEANIEQAMTFGLSKRVIEKAEQFTREAEEKAQAFIEKATAAGLDGTKIAKGAERIRAANRRRVERLSGAGAGIISDLAIAQQRVAEVTADPAKFKQLREAVDRYQQWADSVLQYARDKGRLSPESYDKIKAANLDYMAMHRVMDNISGEMIPMQGGKKLASSREVTKRFKGGTETIGNPYVNLLAQTSNVVREADRNYAMRTVRDLLTNERGMYQGKPIDLSSIGRVSKQGDPDTVRIWVDGKPEYWQFAPDIYRAMKDWNATNDPSAIAAVLQAPAKLTRTLVTSAPGFIVRNKLRDATSRAVVSESGAKPWGDLYFLAGKGKAEFGTLLDDLKRSGGANFGYFASDRADYFTRLNEAVGKVQGEGSILSIPSKIMGGYEKFGKKMEEMGRLDEYRRAYANARKEGMSDYDARIEAAYQARDIMDFARGGIFLKKLNQYVPFVNANVQGVEKAYRAFRDNPGGVVARWFGYVGSIELANLAWNIFNDNEDEYRQLPAYQRDFFWNYKLGNDTWLRIPKPFELGVTASLLSRSVEGFRGDDKAYEGWMGSMTKAMLPVDEAVLAGPYRGAVEMLANYDFFRNRNIVPPHEKDLAVELRKGTKNASAAGRVVQEAVGLDSRQADHLIRTLAGGWAGPIMSGSDAIAGKPMAGTKVAEGLSGVFADSPAVSSRDVQWLQERARTRGELQSGYYTVLKQLSEAYFNADTQAKREAAAKALRTYAAEARKNLDKPAK